MVFLYGTYGLNVLVGCWPLFFLAAANAWMYRKETKNGEIQYDERDIIIEKKSSGLAFASSYIVFVVGGLGSWYLLLFLGQLKSVGHMIVPFLVLAGGVAYFVTFAISVLRSYKQEAVFE